MGGIAPPLGLFRRLHDYVYPPGRDIVSSLQMKQYQRNEYDTRKALQDAIDAQHAQDQYQNPRPVDPGPRPRVFGDQGQIIDPGNVGGGVKFPSPPPNYTQETDPIRRFMNYLRGQR